jgi:hypothetical protein
MVNETVARIRAKSCRHSWGAPAAFRDAVIAVDRLGSSYCEAARSLRAREATITTRLYRGPQYVFSALISDTKALSNPCARRRRTPIAAQPGWPRD